MTKTCRPSLSIRPQVGMGGRTPNPRKLRPASERIMPDTLIYVYTENTRLEGIWHVKWRGRRVYAHLEDSPSGSLLLGRYRDDRITHIDTMPLGTIITSTFLKELPPGEQEQH